MQVCWINKTIFIDEAMIQETAPLITIIVAVFNGKATLQQCIDSVIQQTYSNRERIIIDGGSKDGTVELLEKNRSKFSYWIFEPDRGIYNAWNKGLEQAHGEWICFLGGGHFGRFLPYVLEKPSFSPMLIAVFKKMACYMVAIGNASTR